MTGGDETAAFTPAAETRLGLDDGVIFAPGDRDAADLGDGDVPFLLLNGFCHVGDTCGGDDDGPAAAAGAVADVLLGFCCGVGETGGEETAAADVLLGLEDVPTPARDDGPGLTCGILAVGNAFEDCGSAGAVTFLLLLVAAGFFC